MLRLSDWSTDAADNPVWGWGQQGPVEGIGMADKAKGKFGPNNVQLSMDGSDLLIRVDPSVILHAAGTPNKAGQERKVNLVATTRGFASMGSVQVSLNVTS